MRGLQIVRRSGHSVRVEVVVPAVSRVVHATHLSEVPIGRVSEEAVVVEEIAAHFIAEVVEETGDAESGEDVERKRISGLWDDAAGAGGHRRRRGARDGERRAE